MTGPRQVVARLALPVPAGALRELAEALKTAYGPGLFLAEHDEPGWMLVTAPAPEDVTVLVPPEPGDVPRYWVGDPDPTPRRGPMCEADVFTDARNHGTCTWPPGHAHPQHVAGNGIRVIAVSDVARVE